MRRKKNGNNSLRLLKIYWKVLNLPRSFPSTPKKRMHQENIFFLSCSMTGTFVLALCNIWSEVLLQEWLWRAPCPLTVLCFKSIGWRLVFVCLFFLGGGFFQLPVSLEVALASCGLVVGMVLVLLSAGRARCRLLPPALLPPRVWEHTQRMLSLQLQSWRKAVSAAIAQVHPGQPGGSG